jgi:hypothetical protein
MHQGVKFCCKPVLMLISNTAESQLLVYTRQGVEAPKESSLECYLDTGESFYKI